jgi:pyridoxine 5-phosphate synthase
VTAELAGADGITVHLRQDRRHIQDRDVRLLREVIKTKLNLEMGLADDVVRVALQVRPDLATLVPEQAGEVTTQGGLNLEQNTDRLSEVVDLLHQAGVAVSLFVNPHADSVRAAKRLKADYIEVHTGLYAAAADPESRVTEFEKVERAARLARTKLGLGVNAGHDLTYHNVRQIALIEEIEELSIGHALIARAVLVGLAPAVREMRALIQS